MKSWSFIIVLIHPSICVHNCSHRNMYLFLFPIWVWKLIFLCSFVFSWWLIILVTIVSVAMVKFLATGKFAMDLQISIVYHFLSLEHVVQVIRVVAFSSGVHKIRKIFFLRINIPKGNYWILQIGLMGRCQKLGIILENKGI